MSTRKKILILLSTLGGILFSWIVLLKVVYRLAARFGKSWPCPAVFSVIVNNPIRRCYMRPALDRVGIHRGEHVLEIGPGPGAFTVAAARQVGPEGRLIAVDLQPEMIAQVEQRVREAGLSNVETHVASAYELPLGDESIDRAFLITVLPEIPDQNRALVELRRVLKPDAVLSISEEFLDPDYPFAFETIRQAEAAGFELKERHGNWWIYTLNFRLSGFRGY